MLAVPGNHFNQIQAVCLNCLLFSLEPQAQKWIAHMDVNIEKFGLKIHSISFPEIIEIPKLIDLPKDYRNQYS